MLIASVLAPKTGNSGDYWYCLETRALYEYLHMFVNPWARVPPGTFESPSPPTGVATTGTIIWIDSNDPNHIPYVYDQNSSWISIIPVTYNFPPSTPLHGTIWRDSLSGFDFIYTGTAGWMMLGALTSFSGQQSQQPVPVGSPGATGVTNANVASGILGGSGGWAAAPTPVPIPPRTGYNAPLNINPTPAPQALLTIKQSALSITGLVDIFMDGTIRYAPGYTPNKAAEAMWDAIAQFSPIYKENVRIKELETTNEALLDTLQKFLNAGFVLPEPKKPIDPNDAWNAAMGVII